MIAQYGDIERVKPVINKMLKYCDTTEFVLKNSALTRFISKLNTDSIAEAYLLTVVNDTSGNLFQGRSSYSLGHLNILENRPELARKHANEYNGSSFVGWEGILFSFAGECDRAIELGLEEKELVVTSDCSP